MQRHVYGQEEQNKVTCVLSDKLSGLEKELGLRQRDKSLPTRICGIEESIVLRIVRLESQAFGQTHVDTSKMSSKDRLLCVEEALGVKPSSSILYERIKSLEAYMDEARSRLTNVEEYVYVGEQIDSALLSLPMRLRILEVSLGLESVGTSLDSRVSNVEKYIGRLVSELEKDVYSK
eukprot:4648930-Ditylum_brightwellii.AAC.1